MIPTRLLIGMLFFYIFAQILCNIGEGNQPTTNTDLTDMQAMTQFNTTTTSSSSQPSQAYPTASPTLWNKISQILFFNYSLFYDYDPVTGNKTPNIFMLLRYFLVAIGIVILIDLAIAFTQWIRSMLP